MKYSTFDDLTVRQYQEIYAINKADMESEDKIIQSMCVVTGQTERQVEELPITEFNKIGRELTEIFSRQIPKQKPPRYIRVGGKIYSVIYNPRKLSYAQYAEVQTFIAGNSIINMHKIICSIIKRPFGKRVPPELHEAVSESIRDLKYVHVEAICCFFLLLWNASIKALVTCLAKDSQQMTPQQRAEMKILLQAVTDGSIMPSGSQILKT